MVNEYNFHYYIENVLNFMYLSIIETIKIKRKGDVKKWKVRDYGSTYDD